MQEKKRKIISVSPKNRKLLAEKFGCSEGLIWSALAFRSDSKKANAIRTAAIEEFEGVPNNKLVLY